MMKTCFLLFGVILLVLAAPATAALPDIVLDQIRQDIREIMTENGQVPPTAALDEVHGMVIREMTASQKPLEMTAVEIAAFRNEKPLVSEEEFNRVMREFKKAIQNQPLPHLVAYYERKREAKLITPRQKILCYLLTLRLADLAGVTIPPAPKG
jgi:hypothetical protein